MSGPVPIAIVVCDSLYVDSSGKTALVGLFHAIFARKFPARHAKLCVYVSFTEAKPGMVIKLDIVHSETDDVVASLQSVVDAQTGPLDVCDLHFELSNVVFRSPGLHFIRFWGNDRLVLQRPFELKESRPRKPEPQP